MADRLWCLNEAVGFQIVQNPKEDGDSCIVEPVSGSLFNGEAPNTLKVRTIDLHSSSEALEELAYLKYFSQASVVNALRWRHEHDLIYTNAGLMTVAVNPFKSLASIYSDEQVFAFEKSVDRLSRPHVYAVAQKAYRAMRNTKVDQTILVSGLSGSGKTETVKFTIHYLSAIGGAGHAQLEQQINIAGLLLESFGNAATILNTNSSRFGKFSRIFFNNSGQMEGAEIRTYLLEKSRVSNVAENERNFHIFYHLCNGLTETELAEVFINPSERTNQFAYLRFGANAPVSKNDAVTGNAMDGIRKQMSLLSFTAAEQNAVVRLLAGILHLGNVSFEIAANDSSIVVASTEPSLQNAATLFGVDVAALGKALTTLELKSSNKIIPLTKANAELSRDSLAKEIYERLFDWIVRKINVTIAVPSSVDIDDCSHVSILDISGYENLASNSFEQLCINYTNDKLQQLFNSFIYKEQEIYKRELNWEPLEFDLDLQSVISLVDRKPDGIFGLLDQVCYRLDATEHDLLGEIHLVHKKHPRISTAEPTAPEEAQTITIQHGPGAVEYKLGSFLVKNRDILASSLENILVGSKDELLSQLFKAGRSRGPSASVASFYQGQMDALIDTISETDCSYIKCIKPNADSEPGRFDTEYVRDQIRWSGVLETIQLCDKGYPTHMNYDAFVERYRELSQSGKTSPRGGTREAAIATLEQSLKSNEYALGTTKIFLSLGSHFKLELMLESVRRKTAGDDIGKSKSFWQRTRETWSWMFS